MELKECRKVYGDRYIRMSAFDSSHGWESVRCRSSQPPNRSPVSVLNGTKNAATSHTTKSYAVDRPEGVRYGDK